VLERHYWPALSSGENWSAVVKRPLREWERNPGWTHPSKREIEQWYQKEQAR